MKKLLVVLLIATVLGFTAKYAMGAIFGGGKEKDFLVEKDKAKSLEVEMNLGVGKLEVTGGADEWLEGTVVENKKFKPELSYRLSGKKGKAVIEQQKNGFWNFSFGKAENNWKIALTDEVPVDLQVNAGVSDAKLDLRDVELSNLEVDGGIGDIEINLGGKREKGFHTVLNLGVGKTTVILPKDVGVKLTTDKGIGKVDMEGFTKKSSNVYVNKAFEESDTVIVIDSNLGIGEVTFKEE
ncbi:toast rack family protein [Neobacillus sp. YIM B06451]|uniref:toast rack family protein n=1 Tax=Neobacillus sp. YIM B06451 TaxID=3070994 RepID=UPI00292F66AC|nr:toast rack family protein [Neobacillus sp. YIM B06451]